jgi:ABC-type proline/glycine betaine transport system substrate-binding protein
LLATLGIFVVVLYFAFSSVFETRPVIRVHYGQWNSIRINSAIAKYIIEKGYGYPVELVSATELVMLEEIQKGGIDLAVEFWAQNLSDYWNPEQSDQKYTIDLGPIFESSPQFFVIPKWMAEQYNIETVYDMADKWELFKDPHDPTKGVFYNCIIGWYCSRINAAKLSAYGLSRYYNAVEPGSSFALEAALERAQEKRKPIFSYYWKPTTVIAQYDWHILVEPAYSEECWLKIMNSFKDKKQRLDSACAYDAPPIHKIAHIGLSDKAPDIVEVMKKMFIGNRKLDDVLAWSSKNNITQWEKSAEYYLTNNVDSWETWVSPVAYEKIYHSLAISNK